MPSARVRSPLAGWPRPEYHIRVQIRAPLECAFRWCTEFTPRDPLLEGERFERRVLSSTARRAVFEDLEWTPTGWYWARSVVSLRPPYRWDLARTGDRVDMAGLYRRIPRTDGGVDLDLRWRRRPHVTPREHLSRRNRERNSTRGWRRFAAALEADDRAR
ncbi:MAG: hypothetical protein L3J91_00790 [Thermoplasmata archaeon]|nr:hypothetical protein [Thermoplasmata archaeon]